MLKPYTVTLDIEVVEAIKKDKSVNFSALIRILLKEHLEKKECGIELPS